MKRLKTFILCFLMLSSLVLGQSSLWTRVDSTGFTIFNNIICDINGNVYAYQVNSGLRYSIDNGNTWTWFVPPIPSGIRYITVTNTSLFIACNDQNIYESQKSGSAWGAWQLITPLGGILTNKVITAMDIASWGGNLYVGTSTDGVYEWDGSFWSKSNTGLESIPVTCLLRSENNSNIYVGTNNGFYKSTNNGVTWDTSGLSNLNINALAMDSNENLIVSANNNANPSYKIYRSTNQGNDWKNITFNLPNDLTNYITVDANENIYIGIAQNGCYNIINNGNNWEQINNGLLDINIHALEYSQNGFLYTSVDSGLYRMKLNEPTKLETPILATPANNTIGISLTPTLSWSTVPGADKYRLEVNTKNDFTGTVIYDQDTVSSASKQIGGLFDNTTYYWRVTALNNAGNSSDTSSTFNYTTGKSVLVTATNGATSVSTSPTLSWNKTTGANTYRLEVNTKSDFTGAPVFDNASLTDTTQALSGLSYNTTYFWKVTASSNAIAKTATSSVYSFTTQLEKPQLTYPGNGAIVDSIAVNLKWDTVTGANKYVVEMNSKNDFSGTVIKPIDTVTVTSLTLNSGLDKDSTYYWRVKALSSSGNFSDYSASYSFTTAIATGIKTLTGIIPTNFAVYQNYPNPFNPSTIIRYALPSESKVKITVYNILGQQIKELLYTTESAGYHEVTFNASNLASGIYFYRIVAASADGKHNFADTKKLILMK